MSDTPTPALGDLMVLSVGVGREVSARAERLQRAQAIAQQLQDVIAEVAALAKKVADIKTAWEAERLSVPLAAP